MIDFKRPVVQVALDFQTVEEALRIGEAAVKAGVDWVEAGTILLHHVGCPAIGELVRAFPDYPVLADFKTMDAAGRVVTMTHQQGGQIVTVCGNAADETIQAATKAAESTGLWVMIDTIGVKDQAGRVRQCVDWGANAVYLHYGFDQHQKDSSKDASQWLEEVKAVTTVPVGLATFDIEGAVSGVKRGADFLVIGHPLISTGDPSENLKRYVQEVKGAV
jgi:3-hexulose-6-phosphate synthase